MRRMLLALVLELRQRWRPSHSRTCRAVQWLDSALSQHRGTRGGRGYARTRDEDRAGASFSSLRDVRVRVTMGREKRRER